MEKKVSGLKCVFCGSIARGAKLKFQGFLLDGWKCRKCGEEFHDPTQAQRILSVLKLRKEPVTAKLGRIKSNLILRIPKSIEHALGLKEGENVVLNVKGKSKVELSA